jgi:Na+-transporting NADH:ubiquinone oxidoreductase subunit F
MLIILTSVIVFSAVILLLVLILTFAESKLLPQGAVKILINQNEDKSPTVNSGVTLLSALSAESIFIPSACGGGGTCAQCICQVHSGGGQILTTELNHISRKDAKDDWRLACQVKVRENMEITVPDKIFSIQQWECTVRSNENVATFIKELVLELPSGDNLNFQAGGFIQINIPEYELDFKEFDIEDEYHEDWDKFNIWNLKGKNTESQFRAYSMANHPAEGNIIMLNVRIATPPPALWNDAPPGIASSYMFNLKAGDRVTISGPYGDFFIKDSDREMVYIGGGAGMAPMRSHLIHLFYTLHKGRKVSFWYGARSVS